MRGFKYVDPIDLGARLHLDEELYIGAGDLTELLRDQLTEQRRAKIEAVLDERTLTVIPVMDGIYDRGNTSAVLRSAEGMGYQEAHIIDTQPDYKTSRRVTQGADKWVDVHRWRSPKDCVLSLQERGYEVVATDLDADVDLEAIDFTSPTALVFGNERDGVSPEVLETCDRRCIIPIQGFVQSYNISVAAALSLYEALRQRRQKLGRQGDLTPEERRLIRAHYYLRSVTRPRRLVPSLWRRFQSERAKTVQQ